MLERVNVDVRHLDIQRLELQPFLASSTLLCTSILKSCVFLSSRHSGAVFGLKNA